MRKLSHSPEFAVAVLALVLCLSFAAYTQHEWEDYWITFRASRNLAAGHGLVFTPGERLHTYTSPLGTLLPAAFSWLTGNRADHVVLWAFRFVSAAALAAALLLLLQTLRRLAQRRVSQWLTLGLIGLDAKVVDFTINGMETGLLIFFLALTIQALVVSGPRQVLRLGLGWAGLMWTRPDSCVYIAALALGWWLFMRETGTQPGNKHPLRKLFTGGLICTVLYLPWFLWSWSYYGSPVPHTIVAKGTNAPPITLSSLAGGLLTFPFQLLALDSSAALVFLPAYSDHGGWNQFYTTACALLGLMAAGAWLLPVLRSPTRWFSLTFFLGNYYLTSVLNYFPPWYLPTVAVLGCLALGFLFDDFLAFLPRLQSANWPPRWVHVLRKALRIGVILTLAGQTCVSVSHAWQLRLQQKIIEYGLRQPIGVWLREHARSSRDTVMLEPLGYIGYYSGLKMLDYPGLSSREVVAARRELGREQENQLCRVLKPDWLVLRPWEAQNGAFAEAAELRDHYELVRTFDASEQIKAIRWLPGRPYLEYDQTFLIFRRKAANADVEKSPER